jgi:3-methyladenine DNA glycosylase/8-oxoguanine DNA glycosylase
MAAATSEQLNAIGLSPNKISAIKKISYDIVDHKLNLKKLGKQNDEVIRQTLTQYKYIGN